MGAALEFQAHNWLDVIKFMCLKRWEEKVNDANCTRGCSSGTVSMKGYYEHCLVQLLQVIQRVYCYQ